MPYRMLVIVGAYLSCHLGLIEILTGQDMELTLDRIVDNYYYDGPGYVITVDRGGEPIYQKAIGMADIEEQSQLQLNHEFRIGSITKQFTAVAILRMIEAGTICMTDPLIEFLPDYPDPLGRITLEHLLTHTSGIKSYTELEQWNHMSLDDLISISEIIDLFRDEPVDFAPGDEFRYNNSGYYLLGRIIEIVSGLPYDDYLYKDLIEPLNLMQTHYGDSEASSALRAQGYQVGEHGQYRLADSINMDNAYAAGALVSTVSDLSQWYSSVARGSVMSAKMLDRAWTPYQLADGTYTNYGYGWYLNEVDGIRVIRHGGGINGFSTASAYLPEEDIFVAVFSNNQQHPTDGLMKKIVGSILGLSSSDPERIEVTSSTLSSYAGTYQLKDGQQIEIIIDQNRLIGYTDWQAKVELIPIGQHTFYVAAEESKVRFNVNRQGVCKSLTLYTGTVSMAIKV